MEIANSTLDHKEQLLRTQMTELVQLARGAGIPLSAFTEESWIKFHSLPIPKQEQIARDFSVFFRICKATKMAGESVVENKKIVWHAIKELGLKPCEDLFEKIGNEDIVEFYRYDAVQMFRNFNFFKVCSYSLNDIYINDVNDLWHRNVDITTGLFAKALEIFNGKHTKAIETELPQHLLIEKFSPKRFSIQITLRHFAPLFPVGGGIPILASISRAKVVAAEKNDEVPQEL